MRLPEKYAAPLLLLAVSLAAGLLTSPWLQTFGIDREVFRYSGMAMGKGQLLYADLFDHKPPLIHLLYAATSWAGPWGDWLLFALLHWLAAWMLFSTARRTNPRLAFIIPALWLLLINYPPVVTDGGNTRELCACLAAMLLCTGINGGKQAFTLMGVLCGLICCTQQNEILPLAPPLLFFLLARPGRDIKGLLKRVFQFAAGFLLPVLLMAIWLLATHNWQRFVYHAFTFNTQWYIPSTNIGQNFFPVLHKLRILHTGWLMLAVVPPALLTSAKHRRLAVALTVSLGLCIISAMLGHNFNHYYTAFVPWLVVLALLINPAPGSRLHMVRFAAPVLALVLCAGAYRHHIVHAEARNYWLFNHNRAIDQKLETVKNQYGQLFVFNNPQALQYNHRFGIVSPSRWMYQHVWRWPLWDTGFVQFRREVLLPLETYRTRFILYHETDLRLVRPQLVEVWEAWLNKRYVPVVTQTNAAGDVLRLMEIKVD